MRLVKYTGEHIKQEAELYLSGQTMPAISRQMGIPKSTVSWHLIHPLKFLDYSSWLKIRKGLLSKAKNLDRALEEGQEIETFWEKYQNE